MKYKYYKSKETDLIFKTSEDYTKWMVIRRTPTTPEDIYYKSDGHWQYEDMITVRETLCKKCEEITDIEELFMGLL